MSVVIPKKFPQNKTTSKLYIELMLHNGVLHSMEVSLYACKLHPQQLLWLQPQMYCYRPKLTVKSKHVCPSHSLIFNSIADVTPGSVNEENIVWIEYVEIYNLMHAFTFVVLSESLHV